MKEIKMKILKKSGFTLIELIVAMGLMSLFVTISVSNGNALVQRQKRESFLNSVNQVLGTFRAARSDAISNKRINGNVPEGGFGVFVHRVSESEMRIVRFVDDSSPEGNGEFDEGGANDDTIIEDLTLTTPWIWNFENTIGANNPDEDEDFVLIFLPPNAELTLLNSSTTEVLFHTEMLFQYNQGGQTERRICLNRISRFFEVIGPNSSCL